MKLFLANLFCKLLMSAQKCLFSRRLFALFELCHKMVQEEVKESCPSAAPGPEEGLRPGVVRRRRAAEGDWAPSGPRTGPAPGLPSARTGGAAAGRSVGR
jgi:hypothetical protein